MSEELLWTIAFVVGGLIAFGALALYCAFRALFDFGDV